MNRNIVHNSLIRDEASFASQIARNLQAIYRSEFNEEIVNRILALTHKKLPAHPEWNEKDVILITYGNSVSTNGELPLKTLQRFLKGRLKTVVNCVHILPFFPSTSDDGFAVSDFIQVNPSLGSWNEISEISDSFHLMTDLVINHVSSKHPWFINYLHNCTPGRDYFIEEEPDSDYSMVVRPRSSPLFTSFETSGGSRNVWTTFSNDQIDLNFSNPEVLAEMIRVLIFYLNKGARFIRLDAIAFLWKRKGTNCLHLEETHEVVKLLRNIASYICPGSVIITETNVPNKENWSYFGNGDEAQMVYQFSLPPLLLNAFFSGSSKYLTAWARDIPVTKYDQTFLNYTASHDGIGIRPLEGILPDYDITRLINGMIGFGGLVSMKTNADGSVSPYEINITYYDAMKGTWEGIDNLHEVRFLCSQCLMMSLKGIPAFYIHSILATPNDYDGVEATGRARSINRKQINLKDLNDALNKDTAQYRVLNELLRLIQIRKNCACFHPGSAQKVIEMDDRLFSFVRNNEATGEKIYCIANVSDQQLTLEPVFLKNKTGYDLISGHQYNSDDLINFRPYQAMWILEQ